ncbi:MAG: LysE family translocator [Moraxellaceae bacterium]|nr:LysE family translocator [Moraxellaceae bacterium]
MIFSLDVTLVPASLTALFLALALLAALPGLSVLTVVSRASSHGFAHGALAAAGIVLGDLLFILVALLGLSALAEMPYQAFVAVKWLGGAYLVWTGLALLRQRPALAHEMQRDQQPASLSASFMAGFLLTLADQKAILFYLGFFPGFLDLAALTVLDVLIVMLLTVLAVGGVKLAYAALASRTVTFLSGSGQRRVSVAAGVMMVGVGLWVIVRA